MTLKENFGKRLKQLRESLFMTQEQLAEKIGISRNSLARIENGRNFLSAETLEKIKSVLDIEYCKLFTFSVKETKNLNKALELRFKELNETDTEYFLICIDEYIKRKQKF